MEQQQVEAMRLEIFEIPIQCGETKPASYGKRREIGVHPDLGRRCGLAGELAPDGFEAGRFLGKTDGIILAQLIVRRPCLPVREWAVLWRDGSGEESKK